MSNYVVFTDANCDLPSDLAKKLKIEVMPMRLVLNGQEYNSYLDYRELSVEDFYKALAEGAMPTTAQANPDDYISYLTPILESGKDVLVIVFSSGLSGTYNSARLAVDELKEKYPNRQIRLVDSKSASVGQGLLIHQVVKQQEAGASLEEAYQYAQALVPKISHWFTVNDLHHLKRGGRISGTAALIGSMLQFKPILHVDDNGKLVPRHKARGRKKAIKALFEEMQKTALPGKQAIVSIAHGNDLEAALELEKLVKDNFEVETVILNTVGPVIASHAGAGVLALIFIADHR